mmetsp:Transcript_167855/g.539129  ORF Transcript_167855/g.539129 Transcript_167855/m.539129 type:complete len:83 (+) Transcript_167855:410-658(+)
MGFTYEVGSLLCGLVDLNMAPRSSGPIAMLVTTILGMSFVIHGMVVSPPPDAAGWAAGVVAGFGGLARIQQSCAYLAEAKSE